MCLCSEVLVVAAAAAVDDAVRLAFIVRLYKTVAVRVCFSCATYTVHGRTLGLSGGVQTFVGGLLPPGLTGAA